MKERTSFSFDEKTAKCIEELINSGEFRNKSHVVEYAIRFLGKEKEVIEENNERKS